MSGSIREFTNWLRIAVVAVVSAGCITELAARTSIDVGNDAPLGIETLEACIATEDKNMETGRACIGRLARACLEIAQRETTTEPEKCYVRERVVWDNLVKRYFSNRPKGAKGLQIARVQRVWARYRDMKCGYVRIHHGGGSLGRWQSAICLMEETGRRALELRSFQEGR